MKSLIPLSLAICLVLTACAPIGDASTTENMEESLSPAASDSQITESPSEPQFNDSLIREELKSGSVKNEDGSELFSYEYHIPQIQQDSEEADALNQELMTLASADRGLDSFQSLDWVSHWNGSLLSLIVSIRYPSTLRYNFKVINYDCSLERPLQQNELLERFSLTEENLQEQLLFTAASYLDHSNRNMEKDDQTQVWDLRAQTLSQENLSRTPLFVDDSGSLTGIFTVNVPAGCGYDMPALKLKAPHSVPMTLTDSYATANLQNGKLDITFHKDENSVWSMGENYVPHDVSIPVDRLFGTYVDMTIGNLAQEFWPVVLLLDENGQVTWVDISTYDSRTGSFHGVGPVICDKPVAGFSTSDVFGTTTLCGLDADGNTIDLYTPINESAVSLSPYLSASNWTTEDGKFSLRFPDQMENWNLKWFSGEEELGSGFIYCHGMDEEGIHYQWSLFNLDGDLDGTMILKFPSADSGDMPALILRNTTAESLPGLPAEGERTLIWEQP